MDASSTSITVRWNPIVHESNKYGSLTGYRIKYAKSGSDDSSNIDIKADQTQAEISNLEESTEYKVSVAGLYKSGMTGQYSEEVEAKTLKASSEFVLTICAYIKNWEYFLTTE